MLHQYGVLSQQLTLDQVADLELNQQAVAGLTGIDTMGTGYTAPALPADLLRQG